VNSPRLKSSFIYLANAVNDLRADWLSLTAALAPLMLLTALCVLPSALNLQQAVAERFGAPGTRHVSLQLAQSDALAAQAGPHFSGWELMALGALTLALTILSFLVVMCSIRRNAQGAASNDWLTEAWATWRDVIALAPGFGWIVLLQLGPPVFAWALWSFTWWATPWWLAVMLYVFQLGILFLGALWFLWLYFAGYALVFHNERGFHALLFSRDLLRKRFFRVGMRIVVFLAVWSGYYSWAGFAFVAASWVLGPLGAATGYFWSIFFIVELLAVAVTFVMITFFVSAGYRLYRDLVEIAGTERGVAPNPPLAAANLH